MKTDIHPEYKLVTVSCSCGNTFETRSTADNLKVELCSQCHPFYTGKQKLVDTGGRIDRFERRFGKRRRPGQAEATEDETTEDTAPEAEAPTEAAATEAEAPTEAAAPEASTEAEAEASTDAEASTETDATEAESQTES